MKIKTWIENIDIEKIKRFAYEKKVPIIAIVTAVLLACVSLLVSYAFYQVSVEDPVIGGSVGEIADLEVRVMAQSRDADGLALPDTYEIYPYIPRAGYQYNSTKSHCANGSTLNYDTANFEATINAKGTDVCYLYFDSVANLDITMNIYAEDINSDGEGAGTYTKLVTSSLPSIGYSLERYSCKNGATVAYDPKDNMFTLEATGKDVCDVYMKAMKVDIALKLYIQSKSGSTLYYPAKTIPLNNYYELNTDTEKSACTGTNNALSIVNQKVVISAASRTQCVAYLDVSTGPILESMKTTVDVQNLTVELTTSNLGTLATTYYYSVDGGATYTSSTSPTMTYSLDPATTYVVKAYAEDATGLKSAIYTTTETTSYVFNKAFSYSNVAQDTVIDVGGYYKLQVWGAQGGSYNSTLSEGGRGGYSEGIVHLNAGDKIYIYTGGQGSYYTTSSADDVGGGGANGGGNAGYRGGGGGGGTDIRINNDSLYARVIVAGGGGGAYVYSSSYAVAAGAAGGGITGLTGVTINSTYANGGGGGTQTSGGAGGTSNSSTYYGNAGTFGVGGNTGYRYNSTGYYSNGAGGGGWYGGGAAGNYNGASSSYGASGGGGSGYVYTASTASSYPTGCLLTSDYYMHYAKTLAGNTTFETTAGIANGETGHAGTGYAKVTYVGQTPEG